MKTVHCAAGRLQVRCAVGTRQRGVVMIITLLALVIMLIGSVALARSFNTSLSMAGNLAFKRDLVNQAERAAAVVLPQMTTGALSLEATREASAIALNYSASMLPTNDQGIPDALLNVADFEAVGMSGNDIVVNDQGVTVRYVIDRLCDPLDPGRCSIGPSPDARGGSASEINRASLAPQLLYRLSVRVDGPRNTQAFFQTTFAL